MKSERIVFLDWLRVIACFMIMVIHCCESFYFGGPMGVYIDNQTDALWVTLVDGAFRASVPLFMLASSYLLFPVETDTRSFLLRRFKRVGVPFLLWSLIYAIVPLLGETGPYTSMPVMDNLKHLMFNFTQQSGHLWFVYMILGMYLFMPILSPWIKQVSRKGELAFLLVCLFTTIIPFLRLDAGGEVWGECYWNEFGTFYYFSGFIGYLVLGHWLRTYVKVLSWSRTLVISIPLLLAGWAISSGWFWYHMPEGWPISTHYDTVIMMEKAWNNCTIGVVKMTIGYFLLIRKFNASGWLYQHVVLPVSKCSYGMFLMHIYFLSAYVNLFQQWTDSTGLTIFGAALATYVSSFVLTKIISLIPGGKWLVG